MKIAVFIDEEVTPQFGGGYYYMERILNGLSDFDNTSNIRFCLLFPKSGGNYEIKKKHPMDTVCLGLDKFQPELPRRTSYLLKIVERYPMLFGSIIKYGAQKKEEKRNHHIVQTIRNNAIDLIYYPHQFRCLTTKVPFVATNWDLAHILAPPFPELSGPHFDNREKWYRNVIPRALSIFVESEAGKTELIRYLRLPEDKISVIPIFPGRVVELNVDPASQDRILNRFGINKEEYFFYPAQFWAIKNHYCLIKAFKIFNDKHQGRVCLVLTGSDKGNLAYVKKMIKDLKLTKVVKILGFVSETEMFALYKNAAALVMPTFLGPTNMPILEAMALGCPVACSDLPGHREQAGESAVYFKTTDYQKLSAGMLKIIKDRAFRDELRKNGFTTFQSSKFTYQNAIKAMRDSFEKLARVRNCWEN
jgi:glycosyltransferase involved in cell wall biosynthesis